jgi:hypothetical protein
MQNSGPIVEFACAVFPRFVCVLQVSDPLFFLVGDRYVPVTSELYARIQEGKVGAESLLAPRHAVPGLLLSVRSWFALYSASFCTALLSSS